jgi:cold-inducible RNA-binding protein
MRIYVGNLSFTSGEEKLQTLFSSFGDVDSAKLVRDHATGRSRGFAFVEMSSDEQGRAACQALDQREFEGRQLTVNEARPSMSNSGGGGYGRGKREPRW